MAVKAAVPRHFSICVFVFTQVAIDLEVLGQLSWSGHAGHRFLHTYLGAGLVGLVCFLAGKPLSEWLKAGWNRVATWRHLDALCVAVPTSWPAAFWAAAVGAVSHVLLDSLYHSDIESLWPFSHANPLRLGVHPVLLSGICVGLGVLGLAVFLLRERIARQRKARDAGEDPPDRNGHLAHD
jgi:hypothetical protein